MKIKHPVAVLITLGPNDPESPPGFGYNVGGLVVRDAEQTGDWVMLGLEGHTATHGMAKTVRSTDDGVTTSDLEAVGLQSYRFLVCRVGGELRYFSGAPGTTEWTADDVAHSRSDFGEELQVGVGASAWADDPTPWVEVERVHFARPDDLDHCTSAVEPV